MFVSINILYRGRMCAHSAAAIMYQHARMKRCSGQTGHHNLEKKGKRMERGAKAHNQSRQHCALRTKTESITLSQFERVFSPNVESHHDAPIKAKSTSFRTCSSIDGIFRLNWNIYIIDYVHVRANQKTLSQGHRGSQQAAPCE